MLTCLFLGILSVTVYGQYLSTIPAVIPLIHKSPDVSSWITQTAGNVSGDWSRSADGRKVNWMVAARVDGTGYILQGANANFTAPKVNATFVTSTRTILTMDAGPVRLNLTYLTPIELDDWTRHSLPFGFLSIDLWSIDGNSHSVQLYSDMTTDYITRWNTTVTPSLIYHEFGFEGPLAETDRGVFVMDGAWFFAFLTMPGVAATWQSCYSRPEVCRNDFAGVGKLGNQSDISNTSGAYYNPIVASALDLGNVTQSENFLTFAIGHVRNVTVAYSTGSRWMMQKSLWRRRWSNIRDALSDSLSDFPRIIARAAALDTKIVSDTLALASKLRLPTANLTDLVIMSIRQTIGSIEITTNVTDQGPVKLDDVRVFMKDMGNSGRVSPLEVIYASFPAFLYLNSSLAGKLLEPLFEANNATSSENAQLDLGDSWPSPQPNSTYHPIEIEASGSMLILALAYTQRSQDKLLILKYYNLLLKWADFLVQGYNYKNRIYVTADGSHMAMANLALKQVVGVYAMGKINQWLEGDVYGANGNRTSHYLEKAQSYAQQWQNLSLSSTQDHIVSEFGDDKTLGLLYNLYAVRLIGAEGLIPDKVYELQASLYHDLNSAKIKAQGVSQTLADNCPIVPYENMDVDGKIHWALLAAGSLFRDTTGTRDGLITNVHNFSFHSSASLANPSTCSYDNDTRRPSGVASAANGAAFVFHALNLDSVISKPDPPQPRRSRFRYILGISLAVLVVIISIGVFLYWSRRRRQNRTIQSINLPAGETHFAPYSGEAAPAFIPRPSKFGFIPQLPLTTQNRFEPPEKRRRRADSEVVQASNVSNNQETRVDDILEDNLRRQVERLIVENEALRVNAIPPPPYMGDVEP